jgi:formate dehydrogenase subunit gamma
VLMLLALVYHLGYLGYYAAKRKLPLDMLPSPKDVRDLIHNMQYLLGFRKTGPDFGRWSYIEKFDYFAGAWGKFVMGTTGLVLWFPVEASHFLPGEVLLLSQLFHGREALIAILSLFIWHMYNVHIRPGVWPMSRVWLDGMISMDELQHHHPAEFRQMYPEQAKASHEQPAKKEGGAA